MVVIRIKLHLTCPSDKNPMPDRPWVRAEANENANETIPSNIKIRNNVTSVLKVPKTHFKLHVLQMTETEFRAKIPQWNVLGNIDVIARPWRPLIRMRERKLRQSEKPVALLLTVQHQRRSLSSQAWFNLGNLVSSQFAKASFISLCPHLSTFVNLMDWTNFLVFCATFIWQVCNALNNHIVGLF